MLVKYIKARLVKITILGNFAALLTILLGMDYIYNNYLTVNGYANNALIWALTVTLSIWSLFGILNFCLYSQGVMQDEIERMGQAKVKLEKALLNNRRTSRKRRSKK
jgi:hypothetical protein